MRDCFHSSILKLFRPRVCLTIGDRINQIAVAVEGTIPPLSVPTIRSHAHRLAYDTVDVGHALWQVDTHLAEQAARQSQDLDVLKRRERELLAALKRNEVSNPGIALQCKRQLEDIRGRVKSTHSAISQTENERSNRKAAKRARRMKDIF